MPDVPELVEIVIAMVRGGMSPDNAGRRLAAFASVEEVDAAMAEFARRTGRVRTLKDPRSLSRRDLVDWYGGPEEGDRFWFGFRGQLEREGWGESELQHLDDASSKVVSMMQPPGLPNISTRGLVIGHVQSGKTANFTAVAAKACDVGYKLVIVLGGVIENLRRQTQRRLDRQLVNPTHADWLQLTDASHGFTRPPGRASAFLTERQEAKILCVVLKQHRRLKSLIEWLRSAGDEILRTCPVLILDDEADQASINAARNQADRTAINGLIVEALRTLPKVAYVGYTATPFANVLVNPVDMADVYPRDFIIDLPKPRRHFGPEDIFGREPIDADEEDVNTDGLDIVREVPVAELVDLQPPGRNAVPDFYPGLTPSLDRALRYFLLATAARRVRGQGDQHSTMLVHTTFYTVTHGRLQPVVEAHLRRLAEKFDHEGGLINELRDLWDEESTTPGVTSNDFDLSHVGFDQLVEELPAVLADVEVVVDNAVSMKRLEYGTEPVTCVVIGGNTLARGLTLEGLVVSYMVRTLSAYDSVLQAGRFFGYRPGYGDLPRLWMTTELEQDFRDIARVEAEIRADVRRYEMENLTPEEFAVRIPTHPKLAVTSALKMQHAVEAEVSYSGRRLQTIMFAHRNQEWLDANLASGRELIARVVEDGVTPESLPGRWLLEGASADRVLDFLNDYRFHERSFEFRRKELIGAYIDAQRAEAGALDAWNIVVVSRSTGAPLGAVPLGLPADVPLLNRARMKRSDGSYADIKALMSKVDWLADFRDRPATDELRGVHDAELASRRPRGIGLLLLYPVSKDSRPMRESNPQNERRTRVALDAVEHVLGVGLAFPKADRLTPQSYLSVQLPGAIEEDPWEADDDGSDDDVATAREGHGS